MTDGTETEAKPEIPAGMVEMADGSWMPKKMVKPLDLERDKMVRTIFGEAEKQSDTLGQFRQKAMDDVDAFVARSAEAYDAKELGAKGSGSFHSLDGRRRIDIAVANVIKVDERLKIAEALVKDCMNDFLKGSKPQIKAIVNKAFKTNKDGNVSLERLRGLRDIDIDDPRWHNAMEAIADCMKVVGTKRYLRVYRRDDKTGEYIRIPLDAANA